MKKLLTGILVFGTLLFTTTATFASCPITTSDNTVKQECACPKDCTCGCQQGEKCKCPQKCTCGCQNGEQCTCSKNCNCGCKNKCDKDCTCGCQQGKDCTCDKCPKDCDCGCQDKESLDSEAQTTEQISEPVQTNPETIETQQQ